MDTQCTNTPNEHLKVNVNCIQNTNAWCISEKWQVSGKGTFFYNTSGSCCRTNTFASFLNIFYVVKCTVRTNQGIGSALQLHLFLYFFPSDLKVLEALSCFLYERHNWMIDLKRFFVAPLRPWRFFFPPFLHRLSSFPETRPAIPLRWWRIDIRTAWLLVDELRDSSSIFLVKLSAAERQVSSRTQWRCRKAAQASGLKEGKSICSDEQVLMTRRCSWELMDLKLNKASNEIEDEKFNESRNSDRRNEVRNL